MKLERSAGAFVYTKKKGRLLFLLLRRRKDYDVTKGHIEKDETDESAAKREVFEETGLRISLLPFFSHYIGYTFKSNGEKISKTVRYFIAESRSTRVKVSLEHLGYEWASYGAAMKKMGQYENMEMLLPIAYDYIKRYEAMKKINSEYEQLRNTKHWKLSRTFVPGEGPIDANVVFVGQAPGKNEDKERRPFIGRSGKLLDDTLRKAGIDRKEAYILSAVQFYPPKNRAPTDAEIRLCMPFLLRQLHIIRPRYVVLLGSVSTEAAIGLKEVSKHHGETIKKNGLVYFVTFHPAAALRFKHIHKLFLADMQRFGTIIREGSVIKA